jgi:hypothetical protein
LFPATYHPGVLFSASSFSLRVLQVVILPSGAYFGVMVLEKYVTPPMQRSD